MENKSRKKRRQWILKCGSIVLVLGVLGRFSSVAYATDMPRAVTADRRPVLTMFAQIGAAGATGRFEKAEQLFAQGKTTGLSELQMYEAVLNLLPYIGYPRTLSTMSRFQKVYPQYIRERDAGKDLQPTEPWEQYAVKVWGERGAQIRGQLGLGGLGEEDFVRQLTLLSPELTEWVLYDDFGRIFGRAGLSLIEREAIVIGTLAAQAAPQIAAHRKAMLRVGGSDELIDSLLEAVSEIVDEKALAMARQHLVEARQQ